MKLLIAFRAPQAILVRLKACALEENKTVTQVILDALYAHLYA